MPFSELLDPNVLLLFEIVDFNHIQSHSTQREHTDGLYGLAWAYLRPVSLRGNVYVGASGSTRVRRSDENITTGDGESNLSIRLQLYDYKSLSPIARYQARTWGISAPPAPAAPQVPAVYLQYLSKSRARYTSTLLVRIHRVPRPTRCEVNQRSLHPNERERSDIPSVTSPPEFGVDKKDAVKDAASDARCNRAMCRQRYVTECCVLPDRLLCRINSGVFGALTIQFSPTGRLLAVAAAELLLHPIRLYDATGFADGKLGDVPSAAAASAAFDLQADSGREGAILLADLDGHHGMIYDMRFTCDETYLLSASADGFAKVWDLGALSALLGSNRSNRAPRLLCVFCEAAAHYIYTATFVAVVASCIISRHESQRQANIPEPACGHTSDGHMERDPAAASCPPILTGAYNGAITYWEPSTCQSQGLLGGKISHNGRVHCLEVDNRSGRLYSGDSTGVILVWRRNGSGDHVNHFANIRRIEHPEFKHKPIMSMQLRPAHRRGQLLVQAQSSTLRLVDLATFETIAQFKGNIVESSLIRASFSPEGTIVMAGSEDGKVYAWDAGSATPLALPVSHVGYNAPLCDLSWHPTQHVVAYSCCGGEHPILVYFADRPETPEPLVEPPTSETTGEDRAMKRRTRLRELQARYRATTGRPFKPHAALD